MKLLREGGIRLRQLAQAFHALDLLDDGGDRRGKQGPPRLSRQDPLPDLGRGVEFPLEQCNTSNGNPRLPE